MMKFSDLGLAEPILRAIAAESYLTPTPIQAQAIPHILAGKDLLGCAQTGTGKTAAFALPIAHRLMQSGAAGSGGAHKPHGHGPKRTIRALILSPTRELALQIAENLSIYAKNTHLKHAVIFGGVNQNPQVRALQGGVDIVIATPGRLEDLMQQGYVDLRHVETFVLDEADRMLDMGFIQPIRRIAAAVPAKRQTLLFSATMPKEIRHLAHALLRDPVSVEVAAVSSAPAVIEQSVYHTRRDDKPALLAKLLRESGITRALVFTRTKHGADKVVKRLGFAGITAEAIHGNKRQNVRQRTLANFKSGRTPVLVATDIAARGIDVDDVSHVINYELPHEPETYVHRIGRTGRAGNTGIAIAFCDHEERDSLRAIERLVKKPIAVLETPEVERSAMPERERDPRDFRFGDGRRDDRRPAYGARPSGPRSANVVETDARGSHAQPYPRRSVNSHRTPTNPAAPAGLRQGANARPRPSGGPGAKPMAPHAPRPPHAKPAQANTPAPHRAGPGGHPTHRSGKPGGPTSTRKPHRKGPRSAR